MLDMTANAGAFVLQTVNKENWININIPAALLKGGVDGLDVQQWKSGRAATKA